MAKLPNESGNIGKFAHACMHVLPLLAKIQRGQRGCKKMARLTRNCGKKMAAIESKGGQENGMIDSKEWQDRQVWES